MTSIEAIQGHLAHLDESLAECAQAVTAQADAQEAVVGKLDSLIAEHVELRCEVGEMIGLFKNYVEETSKLRSEVRKVAGGQR